MKNIQLRRENKVLHNGIEKTIDCISPGYVIFLEDRKETENFGEWVDLDEVDFIPITDKNFDIISGLERQIKYYDKEEDCNHTLIFEIKDDREYFFTGGEGIKMSRNIKYFHELQNLAWELKRIKI